jgi:Rieske Fe-S protein
MSTSDSREWPTVSRRSALLATTAFGVAGCAGTGTAPTEPPTPSRAPGGGLPWTATPGAGSGATGTVVGPVAEVPVGGGKVFQALEVVVTQPTEGRYEGFSAICTHTACIVADVSDGTINCACHGSRFNLDGSVANGPAERPLNVRSIRVEGDQMVLE